MTRDVSADPNLPTGIKGWREALNAYKSKTPGLSDTLPTGYDMFGEAGYRADPSAPWATTMTGIRYQTSKQREVDKIVIGLGMPLSMPKRSISVGEEGDKVMIKLQPEEYQFLLKSIGQVTMPSIDDSGKPTSVGVQDAIVGLAKTDAFKSADKDVQQGMVSDIYNDYVGMAVEQLLETKPSVSIRAEAAAARLGIKGKYKRQIFNTNSARFGLGQEKYYGRLRDI